MKKPASKNIEDIIALNPMQEGMLFLYLKDPKSDKNFERLYLEISGKIDTALFQKAWDFVIHTNEMLRTVFRWEKIKEPVQIILKEHHLNLGYFDFSNRNQEKKKKLLKDIRNKDRDEKFDLHQVAFRVTLCKIEEEKYGMLISNHHILYDGWSNGIILKEFFNAYNDLRHNRIPVKPVKGRFGDFIRWIKSQDTDDIKKKQEKFWKDYLEGFEVKHKHEGFLKRKEEVRSAGEYRFKFHAETKRNIENFVKKHKISLSSLFYIAWGLLLQAYNDCRDVLFDTTVSGRSAKVENMENMVGLFINTLPLRVKTHPAEKIIDVLQEMSRMLRYREEFENTSQVFIKEYLSRYRSDVLFDSLVVIENYPLDIKSIEETSEFSFGPFSSVGTTNYDLTVILTIFNHIEVNFIFNNRLLSQPVVEEMYHLFTAVIKNIIENPGKRVTEIKVSPHKVQLIKADNKKLLRGTVRKAPCAMRLPPDRRRQVEQELVKIWSEVLNRDAGYPSIGIDDNFFDLGGHSLSASLLTAAVHKAFSVKLPMGELFKLRTIRNTANYIMTLKKDSFTPILPVEKKEFYPLSSAQKRIYILQRMDPGSVVYNGSLVVVMEGQLNKNRLTHSFRGLVNRHENLRTSFEWLDGEPMQRVHEKVELNISHFQVKRYTRQEQGQNQGIPDNVSPIIMGFRKPFDLDKAPLFRIGLVEIEADKQVLTVDIHHIISDGISRDILVKEFMALYLNRDLPRLQLQYKDFSAWKNERLRSGLLKQQEEYWLEKLSGDLPVLNLPYDFPRPSTGSQEGERVRFYLEEQLTGKLKEFTRKTGITLFMVLLAVYNILLSKYSGQTDIVIGSPAAGRTHAHLENTIGLVIDTIVFRSFPGGGKTFEIFLEEIKETTLEANENQDYPFRELVKQVVKENDLTGNPLFAVMLNVLGQNMDGWEINGLNITPYTFDYKVSWVDLTLEAVETRAGIMMEMEYCTKLFKRSTVEMFARQFIAILEQVLACPSITLAEIGMFHQNQDYLYNVETGFKGEKAGVLLHELVEEAVEKYADHTAVVHHDRQFTYAEVNRRANRLAKVLGAAGVKPGHITAIMVEPCIEMITGILGILKAGGAYLPIDPEYPRKRVLFMLEDSNANALVTTSTLAKEGEKLRSLEVKRGHETIFIDTIDFSNLSSSQLLNFSTSPSFLAYVIYTSGSTGTPKGVMAAHRNAAAYVKAFAKIIQLTPKSVVLQQASFAFDTYIEEVFPILSKGGRIALPDKYEVLDIRLLSRFISRYDVDIIDCSPLLLNELNQISKKGALHKRGCTFISGGDVLKKEYVDNLLAFGKVYNSYGPTETTVCATYYEYSCNHKGKESIPIGKPIPGYHVYILDKRVGFLPVGPAGELCISGTGVTRGYLNRPELTAEKFDHDLWDYQDYHDKKNKRKKAPGKRIYHMSYRSYRSYIYKTGDLARWLPDGCIEFLGRIDRQVKIRGYRIELEEIENKLLKYNGIQNTAAVLKENQTQGKYICVYFKSDNEKNIKELRNFLAQELPGYMMPAHFVRLEKLPVTFSGKIDRKKLAEAPEEHIGSVVSVEEYTAPRNEIELKMAEIWQDIFQVDKIGIDDNFFELGGDSLLAIRCITSIREDMKLEIPLKEFFGRPFIRALSRGYETRSLASGKQEIPRIRKAPANKPIPLSFSQERLWFLQKLDKDNMAYFVPRAIRIIGELDVNLMEHTFTDLIKRHEILRTVFPETDGRPGQRILHPFPFKIPVIDLTGMEEKIRTEEVSRWIREEGQREFDLENGPLLRVTLLKLKQDEHIVVLTEHHLIHDGWTQGVLLREFIVVFSAYLEGKPSPLPELTIQYADFTCWQRDYLQGEVLGRYLEYWRKKLSGLAPVLELPADRPRPLKPSGKGAMKELVIPAHLTAALKKFSKEQGVTLFMTMLTVFKVFLSRYTGVEDLCVGTGAANRHIKELEGMLGMVINTLALRTQVSAGLSFKECLQQVKQTCVEAFEHEDTPFDRVVDAVQPERSLSYNPIFQVFFTFMDIPTQDLALPGLELVIEESHNRSAKFDVNIVVVPPQEQHTREEHREILIECEYNTDIFDDTTIDKMLIHYNRLLEKTTSHPDQRISDISFLSEEEKKQLIYDFNDTEAEYPADRKIHELFEEQAARVPENIAAAGPLKIKYRTYVTYMTYISYRELNQKSNQLAHLLRQKGVVPDTIVAIMVERSIEMVMGILGILKAGGAYLPIDPGYPEAHIKYMLGDSMIKFLVKKSNIFSDCSMDETIESIFIDDPTVFSSSVHLHLSPAPVTSLAYILYTSGSTGKPKGVIVEHPPVVNILWALQKDYPLRESDTYLLKTSYVFDVSVTELFGWFLEGGRLTVLEEHGEKDPGNILNALEREKVTHINFVPSMFKLFADELNSRNINKLSSLKYIFLAGEVLLPELVNKFRRLNTHILLENIYGPTEGTVYSSKYSLSGWKGKGSIPIGKPVQNTRIYILDRYDGLQPIGVPGELCIGGKGVARGYLNRPELTTGKFVKIEGTGGLAPLHIYRTGDLARWLQDGNIEFLGRIDHQVKIRGFRIELEEIENCLLNHEDIKEAVVIVNQDGKKENYLCTYIVSTKELTLLALRDYLSGKLPAYMVPAHFFQVKEIPLTPSGKVNRQALLSSGTVLGTGMEYVSPTSDIERTIVGIWQELLNVDRVSIHDNFFDMGGNSFSLVRLNHRIKEVLKIDIPIVALFNYPTIASLARYISQGGSPAGAEQPVEKERGRRPLKGLEIAVIGMACRFPGAKNIREFWDNLKNGVESIAFRIEKELKEIALDPGIVDNPNYIPAKGILEDKDYFDAWFFGYTPAEAEIMDPQIRIFHECCWEALENAGYDPETYVGTISLYAGATPNPCWEILPLKSAIANSDSFWESGMEKWEAVQFSSKDFLSTRIAYKLDLKGPCVTLQTACSTSLVAVDLASQALLSGKCDMALTGGVSITFLDDAGYLYQEGAVTSVDGHCRAFDAHARGTIGGDGAGVVVLKRLEDAVPDNDTIYAVIKGFAINNDGKVKAGFTAPSVEGQARVIREARQRAGVEPESIGYVEAHGTGTLLGDPIEIEGLKQAFKTQGPDKKNYCAIGSVKTNIGHLDAAAGIAGLIKTVLAIKHRLIPPSLHFEQANPRFDLENSPFYVNNRLSPWKDNSSSLRAGVSSFGLGGTNAHVVLEEWCMAQGAERPPSQSRDHQLILLSAKTPSALDKMTRNLAEHFKRNPAANLADAAYTLQVGRKAFHHRKMLVCPTNDIEAVIHALESGELETGTASEKKPTVVFMFSGQGSQFVNMGLDLYKTEPVFRSQVDHCFKLLEDITGMAMKPVLYPGDTEKELEKAREKIHQFPYPQPIKFIFEYSLSILLMTWGIKPDAMVGYSLGEYAAACLSGVFSLEDALFIAFLRGKLIDGLPAGAMLGVPIPEEELKPLLTNEISLAAVNSESMCVVSGPVEAIEAFEKELNKKKHECVRYHVSKAGHSRVMESILEEFKENIRGIKFKKPQIPFVSGVTGKWITAEEAMDPDYWTWHLRKTVRFADALTMLLKEPNRVFLEVSPGRGLALFLNQHPDKKSLHQAFNLVRHQKEEVSDVYYTLTQIGRLWLQGVPVDNRGFYLDQMPRRIPLPTYPFERDYYKPPKNILKSAVGEGGEKTGLKKNPNIDDWFYVPSWERRPLIKSFCESFTVQEAVFQKSPPMLHGAEGKQWILVFIDDSLGTQLVERWKQIGYEVITVTKGNSFTKVKESSFIINPGNDQDYDTLVKHLYSQLKDKFPRRMIHLWGADDLDVDGVVEIDIVDNHLSTGFYSLIYLAKALGSLDITGDIHIDVVTCGVHEVTGQERLYPGKAAVLGPLKVIPQEYPHINCRHIDFARDQTGRLKEKLRDQLLSEISARSEDLIVAYRNNYRWVQSVTPIRLPGPGENKKALFLRQKGVYLVTGGLGRVGLILAQHLARSVQAKLILTGHSAFPSRHQWHQWLLSHPDDNSISRKIKKIKEIEETGAEVLVLQADVSDQAQMKKALRQAEEKFGPINGVIHCAAKVGQDMYRAIKEISDHDCKEQFKPKVYGLLVLEHLLGDRELDFCLLMSSGSTFLGGLGFAAYSAANNFMDAFVHYYKRSHPFRWISVNWEVWQTGETAMGAVGASLVELSLTPGEGAEVFDRILSWPDALQVINSTGDLHARIRQWIKLESLPGQDQPEKEEKPSKKTRPALSTPYAESTNPVEHELVNIWQELLGYEPIGIRDNFFELGGDSLKAVIVTSKIHKALNIKIPIKDFFSQPFIEMLARYINNVEKSSYFSIELVENREYYPLSSVQKRLFVLNQREKQSTVYNIPSIMMLEGKLDEEKLDETFRKLIWRHESFRTSFLMVDGEPVQRIHDEVNFEIEYYLATEVTENTEDRVQTTDGRSGTHLSSVIRHLSSEFVRPFDLSRAPLLRVGLIELEEDKYILMVDMHHSISDGTSMGIFVKEFMALYQGEFLPPLKLQYRDFSQWQRNETSQEGFRQQKEYWLKQLQGEIPVLNLPLDFPRPVVQGFEGGHVELEPEVIATTALKELAGKEGTTLYMVLLSIYGILLARLSGREDILIGAPIAGRRHADSHHVIGMFVNTLVLRINPGREKKYRDFLRQVKEQTLAAFENQDYPFEDLVEQLGAASDTSGSHNPLFDAAFIFQNIEIPEVRVPGLKLNRFPFEHEVSKFDMMLVTKEVKDTLCLTFEYSTQLFRHETMQQCAQYFKQVLLSVLHDPDQEITGIEILSPEEKQQILYDFNETAADYPREKTIHELFEEQVERVPDVIALHGCMNAWMHRGAYVTYGELNESSNRLAHLLRDKGIQPDTIVGILANRSIEMIVGILGILKSGGAYLPIDPGYPQEWINYVLADSGAKVLVTIGGLMEDGKMGRWEDGNNIEIVLLKPSFSTLTLTSTCQVSPTNLAYIIYTSGTTGKPKGVMVGHGSVVNTLVCRKEEYKMNGDDTSMQLFPYVFDGFVTSFFTPIISGASVVLLSDEEIRDIEKIRAAIVKNKVTHFICVPSLYSAIIESLTPGEASTLKAVTLAGEKVSLSLLENTIAKNNNLEIVNEYGVTESAVMSTIYRHQEKDETVKIGHPVWNTKIYILDRYNRVQPIGVPGELCLWGVGLARGYLNNPEMTAEKFLSVSHRSYISKRIYKTGDLARWLSDGSIEFFGRMDHQVKIRGFRIEIGEIETRLSAHPEIKKAVVIDRDNGKGDKYLCAYIVAGSVSVTPDAAALRDYLSEILPIFMIPSYFVLLERIPLTSNGKVDRKALPAPGISTGEEYLAPGNEIEEQLVEIWSEVLNIEKEIIGVKDNFFDLGGNSLKVMQLNSKLKKIYERDMAAVKMFKYPTIRSFAGYINAALNQDLIQDETNRSRSDRSEARIKGKRKLKNLKQKIKEQSNA